MLFYLVTIAVGFFVVYWFFIRDSSESKPSKPVENVQRVEEVDESKPKMLILFGSQTGTAEEFSNTLAYEARRFGFNPRVMDLVDLQNPEDLKNEKVVVFNVATYGEGEPTDNARDFFEWIKDENHATDMFVGVNFAVFGLGNKQYKIFNAVGKIVDKRMEELGGKRVIELGVGDADDNIEEHFEDWKSRLLPELSTAFETKTEAGDDTIEQKYEIRFFPDAPVDNGKLPFDVSKISPDAKNPYLSSVIVNRQLLNNCTDRSTVHVEFDIKGTRINYEAGDHLAVFAENEDSIVHAYAKRLGYLEDMEKIFSMLPKKQKEKPPLFPKKCNVGVALKYYLDLTGIPRKKILKALSILSSDEKAKQELGVLAANTEEGKAKYKTFIKDTSRTLLDVLNMYPSVKVPLEMFLELVPRLQPRYYSIASSSKKHKESIHAVVAVVKYTTTLGVARSGVCSSYLERLQAGQKAYIFVRTSTFHLPSDMSKPVIMVGPGTGMAPFVGFLQQRRAMMEKGSKLGPAHMFFGCRKKNEDFIYGDDQVQAEKDGVISNLHVAFSREQNSKVYVQHKVLEYKQAIFDMFEKGGYFYICGDAKYMAKDVDKALITVVMECGNKTQEEAQKYMDKLSTTSRYFRDVWAPN